jgi:hypothetical protein
MSDPEQQRNFDGASIENEKGLNDTLGVSTYKNDILLFVSCIAGPEAQKRRIFEQFWVGFH